MHVFSVSADHLVEFWPPIERLLKVYEKRCGELTSEQIFEACLHSRQQLFGLSDGQHVLGVAVTEIQELAKGRVCVIVVGVGQAGPYWMDLLDQIRDWAKEIGCVAVRIVGRKGWMRYDRRFRPTMTVMEACLS